GDRTPTQDDLARGTRRARLAVFSEGHTGRSLAFEQDLLRERASDDTQGGARGHGVQITDGGGAALAVARGGLVIADAVLAGAVEVVVALVAELRRAIDE